MTPEQIAEGKRLCEAATQKEKMVLVYKTPHSWTCCCARCCAKRERDEWLRTHAPALLAAARDAEMFAEAMERGGIDISVCDECGCTVACVPDGMALCDRCAALSRDGGG